MIHRDNTMEKESTTMNEMVVARQGAPAGQKHVVIELVGDWRKKVKMKTRSEETEEILLKDHLDEELSWGSNHRPSEMESAVLTIGLEGPVM